MNKKIIIPFLIFFVIAGVVCFLFFFPLKQETKDTYQTVDIRDEAVLTLYQFTNPSIYYSSMADVYKRFIFSNEYILGSAISLYLMEQPHSEVIKEEDVDVYIRKIFGDVTYAHTSGYMVNDLLCAFTYDKTSRVYTYQNRCEKKFSDYFVRKLVSSKKSETEYILEDKMIFVKIIKDSFHDEVLLNIYSDVSLSHLLDTITYKNGEIIPDVSIDSYIDQASTYQYHFVFDSNSFVYKSIEKVK